MLTLVIAALLAAPAHATTTAALDSGWAYGSAGYGGCGSSESGDVTATTSFTTSVTSLADLTGIHVDIAGQHGGCQVTIDSAVLYLDGTAIWSQAIGVSGSGLDCCAWYVDLDYSPASLTDQLLGPGTHTLQLAVTGTVQEWGEQIAARITATVEHGTDWDGDGYDAAAVGGSDCDDDNASVHPGASDAWYDGVDADCDGASDFDADADGYDHAGYGGTDCDDSSGAVHPAATEWCNGIDDDCDGSIDEASASDAGTWYADTDADGYGDPASTTTACSLPSGYAASSSDCDDGDASVNPGATELCNGVDDDCDGVVDPPTSADAAPWYPDADGDGYGTLGTTTTACSQPTGHAASSTDCDDGDAAIHPDGEEWCNGVDDDCDGSIDPPTASDAGTWYADADVDGYGDSTSTSTACSQPSGSVARADDCDDHDASVHPTAPEYCNGVDDDCDGSVDEGAVDSATWYADSDGDGFGDATSVSTACDQPSGTSSDATDCDDDDPTINPDAEETFYDGVDSDCDGASDYDADHDDFDHSAYGGDDCDDDDPTVNPDAEERWYDGVDSDCDGASDYDMDGDGHDSASHGGDDCDDGDASVYPGAPDLPYDGVVNDCDATDEYDADQDGHDAIEHGGDDCDDANSGVNPSQAEVWYDGVDQDCDGNDDDQDGDGWPLDTDCDDTDPTSYPGAEGLDEECHPVDTGDSDLPEDSDNGDSTADRGATYRGGGGCQGCAGAAGATGLGWLGLLALLGARRRRQR